MAADIISSTTQQFLDIHDIVNNFVIMKDGTVSVLITVDAMNFGLLAEEEQDAVMYAYAGLLNSLNYTVQIVINSQTKDVTSYLQLLKDQESSASNETIRRRIKQYREFVTNLIHDRNVLDKKFYVVIPANSIELGFAGAKSVLPGQSKFDISSIERSILLEKAQNILDPRRDHLIAQFARIGLFSRQLTTQEIIQLFYIRYNPEAAEGQQIGESSSYSSPLVEASIQGSVMNTDTVVPPTISGTLPPTPPAAPQVPEPPAPDTTIPETPAPEVAPVSPPQAPISPEPTTTTPGSVSPLDSMSNVLSQPTMPAVPATAPPITQPPAASITGTPAIPPQQQPIAPELSSTPNPTTMSASVPDVSSNENDIQADLDATVKELGVAPTSPATPVAASTPDTPVSTSNETAGNTAMNNSATAQTQSGDLPPLPEI